MPLSEQERQKLYLMRDDLTATAAEFAPHGLWADIETFFEQQFNIEPVGDVEGQSYNYYYGGTSPDTAFIYDMFTILLYNYIKERDYLRLLDRSQARISQNSGAMNGKALTRGVTVDGRVVSHDQLFSVLDVYALLDLNPALLSEPVIVLDLGAGWGRIGDLILRTNNRATYVVVDIPTSLMVSSSYLPRLHPHLQAMSYVDARQFERLDRDVLFQSSMWFVGPSQLKKITEGSIDFAVNVASFMEMSPSVVSLYLAEIDRVARFGWVYLRNQLLGIGSSFVDYKIPDHWRQKYFRDYMAIGGFYETSYHVDAPSFSFG